MTTNRVFLIIGIVLCILAAVGVGLPAGQMAFLVAACYLAAQV
jgi:hypothetical protein